MPRRSTASLALLALVLAGCTVAAPPPALTAAEIDELRQRRADFRWEQTGLDESLRPPLPRVTALAPADYFDAVEKCLSNAGFDANVEPAGPTSAEHKIAVFVCESSFEYEGEWQNWFSDAQLDYLYAYYRDFLVPCLEQHGYSVANAPTAGQFRAGSGGWHPYFAIAAPHRDALLRDDRLPLECPAVPEGLHDPGWADMWLNP